MADTDTSTPMDRELIGAILKRRLLELDDTSPNWGRVNIPQVDGSFVRFTRPELVAQIKALAAAEARDATPCGIVGEPEAGRRVCELQKGHDGYHQQGNVRWLGYHPAPSRPEGDPVNFVKFTLHEGQHAYYVNPSLVQYVYYTDKKPGQTVIVFDTISEDGVITVDGDPDDVVGRLCEQKEIL